MTTFQALKIAVLTLSDTRSLAQDSSGAFLAEALQQAGHILQERELIPDDQDEILARYRAWSQDPEINVILSTGSTGLTGRDVAPEALEQVCHKLIPGFGELFRQLSYAQIGTACMHSRACAGVAGQTLIFALPGSRGAVRDAWEWILAEQLDTRTRPCNFAELLPRLIE